MSQKSPPLACPVRNCHLPLARAAGAWQCARAHSFDVARRGYVNLLQPQDRRSREPGDPDDALRARARLLTAGIGRSVLEAFVASAATLLPDHADPVVELGCGSGDALGLLRAHRDVPAIGIDLAVTAVDAAARQFPAITWVVANADRRLPLLDDSVSLVLSLHARRNPDECRRVVPPGGHLLVAVPAPDDLIELREAVQGTRVQRDRVPAVTTEHEPFFHLVDRSTVRERHLVNGEALRDLLRGTYRGERATMTERARSMTDLEVTLASDILVLRRR